MGARETADRTQLNPEATWPQVLRHNAERYGDRYPALRVKHYGIWQPYTWKDYYGGVKYLALGLLALGFEPGDKVLIIGDNAPPWYQAELAAQANGGAAVGLFADLKPEEIQAAAEQCGVQYAVVEGQEQVDKLLQIKDELPELRRVIYWNYKGLAHYDDPGLLGYRQVIQSGKDYEKNHPGLFEQNVQSGRADDICALVYTAGTSGPAPKAVVHTYRTMRASVEFALELTPWSPEDTVVPHLPPVWITEQWFGIGCHLLSACSLNFAEAPETLRRDIRETNPSIVVYSASLWESQAARVQARLEGADPIQRLAQRLFLPWGRRAAERQSRSESAGLFRRLGLMVADRLFFRPLKKSLGLSRARICYSVGATLSPEAFRFYRALGLPLKSLYGSTEGGLLAGPRADDFRWETVGAPRPEAEIRFTDQGELLSRQSGTFIGYYHDPALTAEVLSEGWYHTGDSLLQEEDGRLLFMDRLEDRVQLAAGVRVAPQLLEARLRSSPLIQEAWVTGGPDRDYLSAVVVINYGEISRRAGKQKVAFTALADLSQKPEVGEWIRREILRINGTLPLEARIRKFVNFPREFDPNAGELTRSRTLRRRHLQRQYGPLLEAIYGGRSEALLETADPQRDGRSKAVPIVLRIQEVEKADL